MDREVADYPRFLPIAETETMIGHRIADGHGDTFIVYLPKGQTVTDEILDKLERWYRSRDR